MYAGEHDFFAAACGNRARFPKHVAKLSAPCPPPGIRDNTVAAKLVAAVLHLDKRPRMPLGFRHMQIFIGLPVIDFDGVHKRPALAAPVQKIMQRRYQILFFIVAQKNINTAKRPALRFFCLYEAACRYHDGLSVLLPGAA